MNLRPLVRTSIVIVVLLSFFRVLFGPWGWVGHGDAQLYRDIETCVGSSAQTVVQHCFQAQNSDALLAVSLTGGTERFLSTGSPQLVLRLWSALLVLLCLIVTVALGRKQGRPQDGLVAAVVLLLATPLIERGSSGGPELWILTLLLGLAWLLGQSQRKTLSSLLGLLTSCLLMASHPYVAPVLVLLIFAPVLQSRSLGPRLVGGRLWFGWIEARYLCAALGGPVLYYLLWPGAGDGSLLWHRITDVYRQVHPPFLLQGEPWIQGVEYASPGWWVGPFWVFLSIPLMALPLFFSAFRDIVRRKGPGLNSSEASLLLMALGWWGISSLQGSPVADGQDHRLILLGLLVPFTGRSFDFVESFFDRAKQRTRFKAWAKAPTALLLFAFMMAPSLDAFWGPDTPSSLLVGSRQGYERFGFSAFARPELRPEWFTQSPGVVPECQPWGDMCRKDLIPGLVAMQFIEKSQQVDKDSKSTWLIKVNDKTYPDEVLGKKVLERLPVSPSVATEWSGLVEFRSIRP